METTSIRLPIRNLPEQFDRSRICVVLVSTALRTQTCDFPVTH